MDFVSDFVDAHDPRKAVDVFLSSSFKGIVQIKKAAFFFEQRNDYELSLYLMAKARHEFSGGRVVKEKVLEYEERLALERANKNSFLLVVQNDKDYKELKERFSQSSEFFYGKNIADFYSLLLASRNVDDLILIYKAFFFRGGNRLTDPSRCMMKIIRHAPLGLEQVKPENKWYTFIVSRPISDGPHSRWVVSHLLALVLVENIDKINVVYTGEKLGLGSADNVIKEMKKNVLSYAELQNNYDIDLLNRKVKYNVLSKQEDSNDYFGDIVVRFQGTPGHTHNLYLNDIYKNRYTVTFCFHSNVKTNGNSDIFFVRKEVISKPNESVYTIPHLQLKNDKVVSNDFEKNDFLNNRNIVVTVYSKKRIQKIWESLEPTEIDDIKKFLRKNENLRWLFVGCNDPDEVKRIVSSRIQDRALCSRIEIHPFMDLEQVLSESICFIAFKGVFGGGGGAMLARRRGVPVVATLDSRSDISNFIPSETQFESLGESLVFVAQGIANDDLLKELVVKQNFEMVKNKDLESVGYDIYQRVGSELVYFNRFEDL